MSDINFNLKVRAYDPNHGPLIAAGEVQEVLDSMQQELNNRSQWISVEKFQEVPNEGLCWIVHKGRVKHAYHDHKSMFRFSPWSDNVYMAESITAVQPILTPEPPTQEQGE